jgi:hypothetical protein
VNWTATVGNFSTARHQEFTLGKIFRQITQDQSLYSKVGDTIQFAHVNTFFSVLTMTAVHFSCSFGEKDSDCPYHYHDHWKNNITESRGAKGVNHIMYFCNI